MTNQNVMQEALSRLSLRRVPIMQTLRVVIVTANAGIRLLEFFI
jgi:hypothetical protein